MSLERALELADAARPPGATRSRRSARSSSPAARSWARASTEAGGRHGEVVALDAAGERARGATLYVTMEPCAHHGTTPPCVDAILAAGVARVVAGSLDPNPEAGGGLERLREAGVEVEHDDSARGTAPERGLARVGHARGRPFVDLQGRRHARRTRRRVPGSRWVSGEASRRLVHELRAASDAVAVGMGTVRLENPRLDARDVARRRSSRAGSRSAAARCPEGSELELRSGPLEDELRALAAEGVQSLLLEGGPTLAAAFLERRPRRQAARLRRAACSPGEGPACSRASTSRSQLTGLASRPVGEDVLLEAYLREP